MPAFVQQVTTQNTTAGAHTATITPAANGILVVVSHYTAGTIRSGSITDDQGGTYTKLVTSVKASSVDTNELFIRNSLCANAAHIVTQANPPGSDTGGGLTVLEFSGFSTGGSVNFRQYGKQDNTAAATPAPALPAACLTGDATVGAIHNATSPAGLTPPTNWNERFDGGYSNPTTGLEVVTRDSGFTGTTVTWGSASASAFSSFIAELIANSAPTITGPTSIGNMTPNGASASTLTLTTTGAVPSGAKILLAVGWFSATGTLSSVSATGCSGGVEVQQAQGSDHVALAYLDAPSGLASGSTITATLSAAGTSRFLQAAYIENAATGAGFGSASAAQASAQEWATGNLSSTPAAGDFVWAASYNGTGATTPVHEASFGFAENADQNIASDSGLASVYRYAGGAALEGRGWWTVSAPLASAAVAYTVSSGTAYSLSVDPGSYALTGTASGLPLGRIINSAPGSYAVTGTTVGLPVAWVMNAASGSYTVTGDAALLAITRVLNANPGTYTITGFDATLVGPAAAYTLDASPGSYTITGDAATMPLGRVLSASPGSYSLDGEVHVTDFTMTVSSGLNTYFQHVTSGFSPSDTLTFSFYAKRGTATNNKLSVYDWTNSADVIAPTDAAGPYYNEINDTTWTRVERSFTVPVGCADLGLYLTRDSGVTGTTHVAAAQLEQGAVATGWEKSGARNIISSPDAIDSSPWTSFGAGSATAGSTFQLTETALLRDLVINAVAGAYSVSGTSIGLPVARVMSASPGSYTITGKDAGLIVAYVLAALAGSYNISGVDATLQGPGASPVVIRLRMSMGVGQ